MKKSRIRGLQSLCKTFSTGHTIKTQQRCCPNSRLSLLQNILLKIHCSDWRFSIIGHPENFDVSISVVSDSYVHYITTFNVSQNAINICLAYVLHVFGKIIDTSLENKYKYGLAIVHLSKIKSKLKLLKNSTVL